jgi:DNA modification methylase
MSTDATTYQIIHGDCLEVMRGMKAESVHCCVTSPPYLGLRDYGVEGQLGLEKTPEEYVAKMVEVFREVRRVLRKDGTCWLNLGDSYAANRGGTSMPAETLAGGISGRGDIVANRGRESGYTPHRDPASHGLKHKDLIGIPWRVAFALQADGWWLRQDIIWHKPNPMPESVTDRCTKAHEYIFLLTKSAKYFYDAEAIKEDSVDEESHEGRRFRGRSAIYKANALPGGKKPSSPNSGNNEYIGKIYEKRNKRSVWSVSVAANADAHFATYPPKLIEPCISAGCPEGGTVLDMFCGSGTTGEVAIRAGRNFIGIELNPDYVEISRRRVGQAMPLFAEVKP